MKLSGRVLPVRTRPRDDEVLTSWVQRLAAEHGMKVHTFCESVLPDFDFWTRDIDLTAKDTMLAELSRLTALSFADVRKCTIATYGGIVFEAIRSSKNTRWVRSVGVHHRRRERNGQQVCVRCLREYGYLKVRWRLSLSFLCVEHRQDLVDSCGLCDSPLELFRRDIDSDTNDATLRAKCTSCGGSIPGGKRVHSQWLLETQSRIYEIVEQASTLVADRSVDACVYFNGVRLLAVACVSAGSAEEFRVAVGLRTGRPMLLDHSLYPTNVAFDDLSARGRGEILSAIIRLTDAWPDQFVQSARDAGLYRSYWKYHVPVPPYWIDQVVDEFLSPGVRVRGPK